MTLKCNDNLVSADRLAEAEYEIERLTAEVSSMKKAINEFGAVDWFYECQECAIHTTDEWATLKTLASVSTQE